MQQLALSQRVKHFEHLPRMKTIKENAEQLHSGTTKAAHKGRKVSVVHLLIPWGLYSTLGISPLASSPGSFPLKSLGMRLHLCDKSSITKEQVHTSDVGTWLKTYEGLYASLTHQSMCSLATFKASILPLNIKQVFVSHAWYKLPKCGQRTRSAWKVGQQLHDGDNKTTRFCHKDCKFRLIWRCMIYGWWTLLCKMWSQVLIKTTKKQNKNKQNADYRSPVSTVRNDWP